MELKMKMPDLATTDSAIKVVRWLVTPGQPVQRGQALLEVETDKATMEVECIATGTFKEPRAQPGETLLAGQILAVIEVEGPPRPMPVPNPLSPASPSAQPKDEPRRSLQSEGGPVGDPIENPNSIIENPPAKRAGGLFAKNRAAADAKPSAPPPSPSP